MQGFRISNGYFQLWQSFLLSQQQDWRDWGFSPNHQQQLTTILQKPVDSQSDLSFFLEIIAHTQQQLKLPNLALEMAKAVTPAHFGLLGYMASRSASVAEGLEYIQRFSRLVFDGEFIIPVQMQTIDQHLKMYWPLLASELIFLNDLTIAAMFVLVNQFMPEQHGFFQKVEFAHPPQMALRYYQQFYHCPVEFKQPEYGLILSFASLNMRPIGADPSLLQLLVKQAEDALAQCNTQQDMVAKMQWIVRAFLQQQQQAPKIEDIAAEMHMSVRTLQRQLKLKQSSFKQILELERCALCEVYLQKNIALSRIADLLGYSNQSALARAYKQHKGQTLLQVKRFYHVNLP